MERSHSSHGSHGCKAIVEIGSHRKDDWQVQEFRERCIGKGSFTIVCFGIIRGKDAAVKIFNEGTMRREPLVQVASKLTSLDHPNIVKVYSFSNNPEQPIKIATEYVKNSVPLQSFLQSSKGKSLSANELGFIAYQVANGMECVESQSLVHSNMTSNKVLVGDNLIAKISDIGVGLAVKDEAYRQRKSKNFPLKWSAPECILKGIFNIKTDVWSFGILLWVLFTYGQNPYPGMNEEEVVRQLSKGFRMKKPPNVPEIIHNFMLKCWDPIPEKRPSFAALKSGLKSYNKGSKSSKCSTACSKCSN